MLPPANDCSARAACNIHAHMFNAARPGPSISTPRLVDVSCLLLLSVRFPRHSAGSSTLSQTSTSCPRISRLLQREGASERVGGRVYAMACGASFCLSPPWVAGDGGIGERVFAPLRQSLHMASCLPRLFIASFWETLLSPRK